MQITLKDRETITGIVTVYTPPIDISSMSLFTFNLTAHAVSGGGASLAVSFETTDNLEDWLDLGSAATVTAVEIRVGSMDAKTKSYGRYIRARIETTGTSPMFNYSLWLNTFSSS